MACSLLPCVFSFGPACLSFILKIQSFPSYCPMTRGDELVPAGRLASLPRQILAYRFALASDIPEEEG